MYRNEKKINKIRPLTGSQRYLGCVGALSAMHYGQRGGLGVRLDPPVFLLQLGEQGPLGRRDRV